jgi:hypothetical protein
MFVTLKTLQRQNDEFVGIVSHVRWDRISAVMEPAKIDAEKELLKAGMKAIVVGVDGSQVAVMNTAQEVRNAIIAGHDDFPL